MPRTVTANYEAALQSEEIRPVELVEMYMDNSVVYRFALYDTNITWNSNTYYRCPGRRSGVTFDTALQVQKLSLELDAIDDIETQGPLTDGTTLRDALMSVDFNGRQCIVRRMLTNFLSDPNDSLIVFDGDMDSPRVTAEGVFQIDVLSAVGSLNIVAGRKQSPVCPWDFQDEMCRADKFTPTFRRYWVESTTFTNDYMIDTRMTGFGTDYWEHARISFLGKAGEHGALVGEVRRCSGYNTTTGRFDFNKATSAYSKQEIPYQLMFGVDGNSGEVWHDAGSYPMTQLKLWDPARVEPPNWWNNGWVTFFSGQNNGLSRQILRSRPTYVDLYGEWTSIIDQTHLRDSNSDFVWDAGVDQFIMGITPTPAPPYAPTPNESRCRKITAWDNANKEYTIDGAFDDNMQVGDGYYVTYGMNSEAGNTNGGLIELFEPLPYIPADGDVYAITQTCDFTWKMCNAIHDNIKNFGGMVSIPRHRAKGVQT